ncbi:MAG TPA: hypothetical protein VNZ53_37755 [Steroidobacteraceae bacterium]|jgi:uncharacterized repeat protein (TIGR01451 family)|nr:hypothetical protein [Steroidobacteraceae bacterium]
MDIQTPKCKGSGVFLALLLASIAAAQDTADPISIKAIAEVESKTTERGREVVKLVAADRVVPGDRVIYTLEVRNTGANAVAAPTVTHPVPEHMLYIADTAVGPGAEVSYSVDGGRSFDRAENLKVPGEDGRMRPAVAADYTDIRWQLKNSLKANSTAFVRFRALVK